MSTKEDPGRSRIRIDGGSLAMSNARAIRHSPRSSPRRN